MMLAMIIAGSPLAAGATLSGSWLVPGSFLWRIVANGEHLLVQNLVKLTSGDEAKMRYLEKEINERIGEIKAMEKNGDFGSDGHLEVEAHRDVLMSEYFPLAKKVYEAKGRPEYIYKEIGGMEDALYRAGCLDMDVHEMDSLRDDVVVAQNNGDEAGQARLLDDLKKAKEKYENDKIVMAHLGELDKQRLENAQDMLNGADKIKLALAWAETNKAYLASFTDPGFESDKEQLKAAGDALDGYTAIVKNIPLDNVDNDYLNELQRNALQNFNRPIDEIVQKHWDKEAAKQLPNETVPLLTQPPPAPPPPAPEPPPPGSIPPGWSVEGPASWATPSPAATPPAAPTSPAPTSLTPPVMPTPPTPAPAPQPPAATPPKPPTPPKTPTAPSNPAPKPTPQPQVPQQPPAPAEPEEPPPDLEPIPSESVQTEPLQLFYVTDLAGWVGQDFSEQLYAEGGLPPYHYQLGTGVGFPPHGIVLDVNGLISGTPSVAGTSTFSACVVDTAGASDCGKIEMVVDEVPQATATLDSFTCALVSREPGSSVSEWQILTLHASGTLSGTVDGFVQIDIYTNHVAPTAYTLNSSWTKTEESSSEYLTEVEFVRGRSDPKTTQWTAQYTWRYDHYFNEGPASASIRVNTGEQDDYTDVTCTGS